MDNNNMIGLRVSVHLLQQYRVNLSWTIIQVSKLKQNQKPSLKINPNNQNLNHLRIIISRQPQNLSVKALVPCLKTKEMTLYAAACA